MIAAEGLERVDQRAPRLNLADVAATVVQQYQEAARRKKIEIETDFSTGETSVLADASISAKFATSLPVSVSRTSVGEVSAS